MTKRASRLTREHVAHHEAGHFVADCVHAMIDDGCEITIEPAGDAAGQNLHYGHPLEDDSSRQEIERFIIGLFAGYAAEVRFDPSRVVAARETASSDDAEAETALGRLATTKAERNTIRKRLRMFAGSLVEDHWRAVCALAQALLGRGRADAYEATLIVAIAEGDEARESLAIYRRNRDASILASKAHAEQKG